MHGVQPTPLRELRDHSIRCFRCDGDQRAPRERRSLEAAVEFSRVLGHRVVAPFEPCELGVCDRGVLCSTECRQCSGEERCPRQVMAVTLVPAQGTEQFDDVVQATSDCEDEVPFDCTVHHPFDSAVSSHASVVILPDRRDTDA